ncbi:MAG: hypothetical protein HYT87_06105 [Nitrospirae bacterium]|nr:hypothetical protein [Nitrospirota bacterium]
MAILCCHCLRNLAFYRAGWRGRTPIFGGQFWRSVNGNFLDVCVLEWCKLFGDERGKHYWRKVISHPDAFFQELLGEIGVAESKLDEHIKEMRTYRDKFVAHLDDEEVMQIPTLTITLKSVSCLYDYLLANEGEPEFFSDAIKYASTFYRRFLVEGEKAYKA